MFLDLVRRDLRNNKSKKKLLPLVVWFEYEFIEKDRKPYLLHLILVRRFDVKLSFKFVRYARGPNVVKTSFFVFCFP